MKALSLLVALSCTACSPAPEAPAELADLSLYLFAEFHADDADVLAGLENLSDILHNDFDYDADVSERQLKQPPLTEEFLGGANTTSAFDPDLQKTVSIAYRSRYPISRHVAGTLILDQNPLEPSATTHDRTVLSDGDCWVATDCDTLDTVNFIVKSNVLYTVPYDATKVYRRLTLDDGRDALMARVDQPEIGYSDTGTTSIDQNFSLEIWVEDKADAAQSLRIQFVWTALTIEGIDLESMNIDGILTPGMESTMIAHDAWYDEH